MGINHRARQAVKRIILGPSNFPQQCVVGLRDPQSEITVWLHGLGAPRDVTSNHLMACGAPFIVGIGFEGKENTPPMGGSRLSLKFHERGGDQQLLGEIGLQYDSTLVVGTQQLRLFRIRNYKNYCLSKPRLWARYLQYARMQQGAHHSDVPITTREVHAMIVFYICPRPVVLVSVEDGDKRNMFPMNLMGPIGNDYFAFALNSSRAVAPLVESAGRVAVSNVPLEHASMIRQLGGNHKKASIDWDQLKFATTPSPTIGVRVPEFALRVREMQVEAARRIGSHTLFVAKTVLDDRVADGLQFFVVHGVYQAWRQKSARPDITVSLTTPAGITATQPQSLCYNDDETRVFDRVLAVDQTNSMNWDGSTGVASTAKMDAARAATNFFVDPSNPNDRGGVISFQRRDQDENGTVTDPDELA